MNILILDRGGQQSFAPSLTDAATRICLFDYLSITTQSVSLFFLSVIQVKNVCCRPRLHSPSTPASTFTSTSTCSRSSRFYHIRVSVIGLMKACVQCCTAQHDRAVQVRAEQQRALHCTGPLRRGESRIVLYSAVLCRTEWRSAGRSSAE